MVTKDKMQMSQRIVNHALEIICLLTGEVSLLQYLPKIKIWNELNNDCLQINKMIVKHAQEIIYLVTGEMPAKCGDVAVYFSAEEWEHIENHRECYKDVMDRDTPDTRRIPTNRSPESGDLGANTDQKLDIALDLRTGKRDAGTMPNDDQTEKTNLKSQLGTQGQETEDNSDSEQRTCHPEPYDFAIVSPSPTKGWYIGTMATKETQSTSSVKQAKKKFNQGIRMCYDANFKIMVINAAEETNNSAAGRKYGVTESNVRRWRAQKAELMNAHSTRKAFRGPKHARHEDIDKQVVRFVGEMRDKGHTITREVMQNKALELAKIQGIPDFKASMGWCRRMMKRNGLALR